MEKYDLANDLIADMKTIEEVQALFSEELGQLFVGIKIPSMVATQFARLCALSDMVYNQLQRVSIRALSLLEFT